jgi:hypothetical protein
MKKEIESVRDEMHRLLDCTHVDSERILFVSRKLDKLIVEYHKKNSAGAKLIYAS